MTIKSEYSIKSNQSYTRTSKIESGRTGKMAYWQKEIRSLMGKASTVIA